MTVRDDVPEAWEAVAWTDEVHAQMNKEQPDIRWLRSWILANYAVQSGTHVQPETATPIQLADLAKWLAFQELNGGTGILIRRWRRLDHILFSDYSTKINAVSQRHCSVCHGGRHIDELFPISRYTVRITPISQQASKSKTGMLSAFQAAFEKRFSERPVDIGATGRVCMALTFVLSRKNRIGTWIT